MKKYEYVTVVRMIPDDMFKKLKDFLNEYGKLGWQLVYHNDGHTFIFMRELVI